MLLYCITLSSSRENQRSAQEVATLVSLSVWVRRARPRDRCERELGSERSSCAPQCSNLKGLREPIVRQPIKTGL